MTSHHNRRASNKRYDVAERSLAAPPPGIGQARTASSQGRVAAGRQLQWQTHQVPGRGLEPLRIASPDTKSGASTNFATSACAVFRMNLHP